MKHIFLVCLSLLPAATAGEIFRDDFSRFPPRISSEPVKQLTNALHEYHYVHDRGVSLDPWANPLIDDDAWCRGDEDGKPYVEMDVPNKLPRHVNATLIVGEPEWLHYT